MTWPLVADEFKVRRSCSALGKLLRSPGAVAAILRASPDPEGFGVARIHQIIAFSADVLDESLDVGLGLRRHRLLKKIVRESAAEIAAFGSIGELLPRLQAENVGPLVAADLGHVYNALREGILCDFHRSLGEAIVASALRGDAQVAKLPLAELAWARTITLSTVAASLYSDEASLMNDPVFRSSDESTRQIMREAAEHFRGATENDPTKASQTTSAHRGPILVTILMAASGWALGVPGAVILLLVCPFLMVMIQAGHACSVVRTRPRRLCAYDVAACPNEGPIAITVPVLLHGEIDEKSLAMRLKENFYGQGCPCIVVLLTDFEDSEVAQPTAAERRKLDSLLQAMEKAFEDSPRGWVILHRGRRFSQTQREYIGWERKRGKLLQFCQFLCFGLNTYSVYNGDRESLTGVQWLLVLDEDSMLMPGAAAQLLAAAMHPLNRSTDARRAKKIFAPSVATVPTRDARWRLDWLYCSSPKRNPWFETYREVPFCGKGMFRASDFVLTAAHLPAERVLSHDTLEGYLLGTAYCDQALVVEHVPKSYSAVMTRLHRWIRGDIQNWIYGRHVPRRRFPRVHSRSHKLHRAGQFLFPFALLSCAYGLGSRQSGFLAVTLTLLMFAPAMSACLSRLLFRFVPSVRHMISELSGLSSACFQHLFRVLAAAHLSAVIAHASAVVIARAITCRKLLDWTASGRAGLPNRTLSNVAWASSGASMIALLTINANLPAGSLLLAWTIFPAISSLFRVKQTDPERSGGQHA